jgi:CheY-specific phosphatase CheX
MRPTDQKLEGEVLTAATEVLEAMYFTTVMGPAQDALGAEGWLSELEFKGDLSGFFALRMGGETARMLAANFFGEDESEVSETSIGDMVGEMANMICGSVLSRMGAETHFTLSHPSVEQVQDGAEAGHGRVYQLLETDSGVLAVCLQMR